MEEPIAFRRRGRVSGSGALTAKGEPAGQTERDFEVSRTDRAREGALRLCRYLLGGERRV